MRRALAIVALTGCNAVFGLGSTNLVFDAPPDIPRIFTPPDGSASCPAPPALDSWTYTPRPMPQITELSIHPSFLADDDFVFMYQTHLFEAHVDGLATRLTELEQFAGDEMLAPCGGAGRDAFWFLRQNSSNEGLYLATRSGGTWQQQLALLDATTIDEPGMVAFYDGTARMIVSRTLAANRPAVLDELASVDGLHWTEVGVLPLDPATPHYDPAISPDGCYVLYTDQSDPSQLFMSTRAADGTFGAGTRLAVSDRGSITQPTISPTGLRIWLLQDDALIEVTP